MNIAIIGATGKAGSRILKEAVGRGHQVTAIVRHPDKLNDASIPYIQKNIFDLAAEDLTPFDVVVNAFAAPVGQEEQHIEAGRVLIKALSGAKNTRLIVVGGAGSLYVDEEKTTRLLDTPDFPEPFFKTASSQARNLEELKQSTQLFWTFISPSAIFALGKRTGHYKIGDDHLLLNASGESYVSYEDYAVAVVDEIEQPRHINTRFTVVSESE